MEGERDTSASSNRSSGWRALPKWTKVVTVILVLIALVFGVSLLRSSQAIVGSVHKRNFHIVEIAANGLETWPRDIEAVARNSVGLAEPDSAGEAGPQEFRDIAGASESLTKLHRHPDLGDFRIHYRRNCTKSERVGFSPGILPGEGTQYTVLGRFDDKRSSNGTTCYLVKVPLDRLVDMRFENREIHNFLIADRGGRIVEQVSERRLPVVSIGKLGANDGLAKGIVATATGEASQPVNPVGLDEVRNVAPVTISGTSYLAYVKPFDVPGASEACRPTADSAGKDAPRVQARSECFAVALMPAQSLRRSWLSPPPVLIVGFGLGLAAVLALLPLIRLLLIGGAEAVSGLEVLGIVLGLPAALTIATFGILFAVDVTRERATAERETTAVAHRLALQAGEEIRTALDAVFWRAGSSPITSAQQQCSKRQHQPPLALCPEGYGHKGLNLELFLFAGPNGKIDASDTSRSDTSRMSYAFRTEFPGSFDVSARDYFIRLRRGEGFSFPKPDDATAGPCAPGGNSGRFTIDQVRAQTDGYDKTVLAVPCPAPIQPGSQADPATTDDGRTTLLILTLKAFLSPVLPDPVGYMVIDASKPNFPVLFHQSRGHAGVESFADQAKLTAVQADRLMQVANGGAVDKEFSFRARYDGERTIFSAVRVNHTPWVVLAWQRADEADGIAARTATRAMFSWVAIALVFLVACIVGLATKGNAWRQFWPHESAQAAYVHLARVLETAAVALLAKLLVGELLALVVLIAMALVLVIEVRRTRETTPDRAASSWIKAARHALPETSGWKWYSQLLLALTLLSYIYSLLFTDRPLLSAVALWVFAPAYAAWRLEEPKDSDDPLTPPTERAYRNALLAFFACIALVPAVALWEDGRKLSYHLTDVDRLTAARAAIEARADKAAAIRRALFLPLAKPDTESDHALRDITGQQTAVTVNIRPEKAPEFSGRLWLLQTGVDARPVERCNPDAEWRATLPWLCRSPENGAPAVYGVQSRQSELPKTLFVVFGLLVAIALLLTFAWQATARTLDALAGFGVPLGAVKGRQVRLANRGVEGGWKKADRPEEGPSDKPGEPEGLSARTLLVAPQQAVRERLGEYPEAWTVDLADMLLDRIGDELDDRNIKRDFKPARRDGNATEPALLIASGLELLLRDIPRRRAALKFLETAEQKIGNGEQRLRNGEQKLGGGDIVGIVVIAEMSPLERILDAFESGGTADESTRTTREELRWARLFQTFETIIFAPIDKVGHKQFTTVTERPVWRLIAELRWLPSAVIDGTTGENLTFSLGQKEEPVFPLAPGVYQESYRADILRWARSVNPCSEEAAIDHLRSALIEHYEQCWVASTLAERLVLDAIARGHFVNMRRALPLQSLVRRGLVVLDPSPRLMNRSFALFVRQAERPDTLAEWREKQPRSGWKSARLPLLITIPIAIIGVTLAAAESGQELTAIFSVFAAGAPVLLSTLFRAVRPA